MRIKNKKTGEIGELSVWRREDNGELTGFAVLKKNEKFPTDYNSLAELNAEWEDYVEPKRTWFIDTECGPDYINYGDNPITDRCYDGWNELGICFESKEEAEKAVEKLKAWKRLKDGGFRFVCWNGDYTVDFSINGQNTEPFKVDDLSRDLCVVFRGEE